MELSQVLDISTPYKYAIKPVKSIIPKRVITKTYHIQRPLKQYFINNITVLDTVKITYDTVINSYDKNIDTSIYIIKDTTIHCIDYINNNYKPID